MSGTYIPSNRHHRHAELKAREREIKAESDRKRKKKTIRNRKQVKQKEQRKRIKHEVTPSHYSRKRKTSVTDITIGDWEDGEDHGHSRVRMCVLGTSNNADFPLVIADGRTGHACNDPRRATCQPRNLSIQSLVLGETMSSLPLTAPTHARHAARRSAAIDGSEIQPSQPNATRLRN